MEGMMMAASVRLDGSSWGLEVLYMAAFVGGLLVAVLASRK